MLGARGSDEPAAAAAGKGAEERGMGAASWQEFRLLRDSAGGADVLDAAGVDYPAVKLATYYDDQAAFEASVEAGAAAVVRAVQDVTSRCSGRTRVILSGYSQGAWAVRLALARLTPPEQALVLAVTLFGDPLFEDPDDRSGAGATPRRTGLAWRESTLVADLPAVLATRTLSDCVADDFVCRPGTTRLRTWAACLGALGSGAAGDCPHLAYASGGHPERAAAFALQLARGQQPGQ